MKTVQAGSTDVSVRFRAFYAGGASAGQPVTDLTAASAGLSLWYQRTRGAKTAITPLSDLPLLISDHIEQGFIHIGDGYYRLDAPDAAFAAGAPDVAFGGSGTEIQIIGECCELIGQATTLATPESTWAYANRTLTVGGAQAAAGGEGGTITVLRGDQVVINLAGVGSLVGRSKLWFTVKSDPTRDPDADAVLQLTEAGGLARLNGAAHATPADGAIEVTDAPAGDLTLTIRGAATRLLPVRNGMSYDLQMLLDGEPVTRTSGAFNVTADVTHAVS